jgi:cell division protein FtsX
MWPQKCFESAAASFDVQKHLRREVVMKRIAMVLFVLILCVVGFGFYRGWFSLSSSKSGAGSNQVNISLTVDPDRMKADSQLAKKSTVEPVAQVTQGAK